jgi:hypothetical protein
MTNQLHLPRPAKHRVLVYTSAGDDDNLAQWVSGRPEFDLFATYYGDGEPRFAPHVNYWHRAKGSKYENLKRAFERWPDTFRRYEAVFALDDDIRISTGGINRLFEVRRELGFVVLQPAMDPRGRISHVITRVRPESRYRTVSFVENGVALFRADALWSFLEVYDPRLNGFGVDWWYVEHLGLDTPGRAAIVDEVVCANPRVRGAGKGREIDLGSTDAQRRAVWELVKREKGLRGEAIGKCEFAVEPLPAASAVVRRLYYGLIGLGVLPRSVAQECLRTFPTMRRLIRQGGHP